MRQCVGQTERIARPAIHVHEPFQRLEASRHALGKIGQELSDDFVLAGIDHRHARAVENRHRAVGLRGFEQRFHQLLRWTKIFRISVENLQRQSGRLIPLQALDVQIEQQLGLFAALFEIGNLLEDFGGLREIALRGMHARLDE